jgi:iron complex transport system ATP-binding protein
MQRLTAEAVTLGYDQRVIARDLSVAIPDHSFTVIVGPNACGKSTLLRALSRMLRPSRGQVLLDGTAIHSMPAKKVARTLGLLPQSSLAPDGITVADLVARGRYPHQGLLRQWSPDDERIVGESMASTGVAELADRYVDELSGGQRQRVWIAMALAQQTPLLLLDEPTTFLDIQIRSTCSTSAPNCTRHGAARWWPCCTTSTTRPATPPTSSRCATARSWRRAHPRTSSPPRWWSGCSGCAAR